MGFVILHISIEITKINTYEVRLKATFKKLYLSHKYQLRMDY